MKFKVVRQAAYVRIVIEERLEPFHLDIVRDSIRNLIDTGYKNLVIDMSAAGHLDKRPMAVMTQLLAFSRLNEGVSVVVSPTSEFSEFLSRTGLDIFVNIVPSAEKALPCLLARMHKTYDKKFFKLLIDREIVTKRQLKEVIALYKRGDKKFGDILLERGYLNIENLLNLIAVAMGEATQLGNTVLDKSSTRSPRAEKTSIAEPSKAETDETNVTNEAAVALDKVCDEQPPLPDSEFLKPSLLGEILVEEGFITAAQLKEALALQNVSDNAKLGDILIEKGFISNTNIFEALKSQCRRRGDREEPEASKKDDRQKPRPSSEFIRRTLLGDILLDLGLISEQQLRHALEVQKDDPLGRQLGDILVDIGAVTPKQLLAALEEQALRKN